MTGRVKIGDDRSGSSLLFDHTNFLECGDILFIPVLVEGRRKHIRINRLHSHFAGLAAIALLTAIAWLSRATSNRGIPALLNRSSWLRGFHHACRARSSARS